VSAKHAQLLLKYLTRAQVVALLLLASIAWATTAELTHRHGLQSAGFSLSKATAIPQQPAAPQVETSDREASGPATSSASDCLICQLHQNLSSTLFSCAHTVAPAEALICNHAQTVVFLRSEFRANEHGRGPPSNL
jgi:hypothetical protein